MTTQRGKITEAQQFAAEVTKLVREKLAPLPEQQLIAHLDALHDILETELWMARMELESIAGPPLHEVDDAPIGGGRTW